VSPIRSLLAKLRSVDALTRSDIFTAIDELHSGAE